MNKRIAAIAMAAALLLAGFYYGSPYWAVHEMRVAAKSGQGDRLAYYIDFPAVRESLKTQFQADLTKHMQTDAMKANPFAGLGAMLAGGMVNMLVDTMVTPESLANMVNKGTPKPANPAVAAPATASADATSSSESGKPPRIERHYEGMRVFKVDMYDPQTDKLMLTMVLNRDGWFGWKLKSIRIAGLAGE